MYANIPILNIKDEARQETKIDKESKKEQLNNADIKIENAKQTDNKEEISNNIDSTNSISKEEKLNNEEIEKPKETQQQNTEKQKQYPNNKNKHKRKNKLKREVKLNIKNLRKIDWWIPVCAILLCIIGLAALFSASYDTGLEEFKKQAIWIVASIVMMIITMIIDYKILVKISPILYGLAIILLIAVLFTEPVNGARSWFEIGDGLFSFQPAEISKIFIILFLSYIISIVQRKGRNEINKIGKLLLILLAVGVPLILIIIEPDYGTATAYIIATI